MTKVSLDKIKEAAKSLDGQSLKTLARQKEFRLEVGEDGLYYILASNDRRRRQAWIDIEGIIDQFNVSESFRSSDYSEISRCASYVLPLIQKVLND